MSRSKKRVLFVNEAHYLASGFSTYGKEVLPRIFNSGKYELAELAVYSKANDPRNAGVPWKIFNNSPIHDDPNYNNNMLAHFGEYSFDRVCAEFKPDIVCIPPGELVKTSKGYKKIEEIKIGDKVLTHKGRYREVTRLYEKDYDGDLVLVTTEDSYVVKRTTPEHPYLTSPKTINDIRFLEAEYLKEGMWLYCPVNNTVSKQKQIISKERYNLENDIELNSDFWELAGYLVSNAFLVKNSVYISFNKNDLASVARCYELFNKVFQIECSIGNFREDYDESVLIHNSSFAQFFKKYFGRKFTERKVPSHIWKASEEDKLTFLSALSGVEGFCWINNEVLTHDVRHLYLQCGIHCSIAKKGSASTQVLLTPLKRDLDVLKVKITNVRREHYSGKVYNLEVLEDNSYVYAGVVVHNCDIRDPWMYDFQERSPARPYFKWVVMTTADSEPFYDSFVQTLKGADAVLAYSEYGLKLLDKYGGGKLKTRGIAPPCADKFFRLVVNKNGHKSMYGVPTDSFIIGTVMRNQKRKLFPEILDMFNLMLSKMSKEECAKSYLYFHTSWPDLGWNIPKILKEYKLGHKVFFTYYCYNCKDLQPSLYQDVCSVCNKCGSYSSRMPSVGDGLSREDLCKVYNFFDLYLQYATNEGFGMGQVEAGYAGVPVAAVDYSAMQDIVKNLDGIRVDVQRYFRETEGMTYKALPDNNKACDSIIDFMRSKHIKKISLDTRNKSVFHYDWDKTAKVWMDIFDSLECENLWDKPIENILPFNTNNIPKDLNDIDFVNFCLDKIALRPDMIGTHISSELLRNLLYGFVIHNEGGNINTTPFDRNGVVNYCLDILQKRARFEKLRALYLPR